MVRGPRPPRASQRVATLTAERALAAKSNSPRFPCPRTRINDSRLFLRRGCYLTTRANDRPHCSNGREFTVISRDLLRSAVWKCLRRAWPAGIPGARRRSLGAGTNLHDALAIHRGESEQSCGGPQPGQANFVRADPRSRYGRKSWFFSQEAWLVHPVVCPLHPEGVDSAGPPRVRHG